MKGSTFAQLKNVFLDEFQTFNFFQGHTKEVMAFFSSFFHIILGSSFTYDCELVLSYNKHSFVIKQKINKIIHLTL